MTELQDDAFDAELRGALSSSASAPSADFAERVLFAELKARGRRQLMRAVAVAATLVLVIGVGGTVVVGGTFLSGALTGARAALAPPEAAGRVTASDATASFDLGVTQAVLEPGSAVRWQANDDDAVRLDLDEGAAFLRTRLGLSFVTAPVTLALGDVTASLDGTTVHVTRVPEHTMSTTALSRRLPPTLLSGLGGAAAGAVFVLAVQSGTATLTPTSGPPVVVEAGETALVAPGQAPQKAKTPPSLSAAADASSARIAELERALAATVDAADGDLTKLLAENTRLRAELSTSRAQLQGVVADRKHEQGEPLPFPPDLAPRFQEAALLQAFRASMKEAGVAGDVTHIDCSEFPCIVYGTLSDRDDMARLESTASLKAYADDGKNISVWASMGKEGPQDVQFGAALSPKDDAQEEALTKRIRHRNQQVWDGMKP